MNKRNAYFTLQTKSCDDLFKRSDIVKNTHMFFLFLLSTYLITNPFYLANSGSPQFSDYMLVLFTIIFFLFYKLKKDIIFKLAVILIFIIVNVNAIWSAVTGLINMNVNSFYYIFNIAIMLIIINAYRYFKSRLMDALLFGSSISLIVQFTIALFTHQGGERVTLFFNNPNQLGYYALLQLSFITLFRLIYKLKMSHYIVLSMMSLYLIFLSLSSAAIIAGLFLFISSLFYYLFHIYHSKKTYLIIGCLLLLSPALLLLNQLLPSIQSLDVYENIVTRMESKTLDAESNFSERRYDRVFHHPHYWFLGAGEGAFDRFRGGLEIHSSVLGFFFYYGIIGLTALLTLWLKLLNRLSYITVCILVAVHFYGLTHQGLRETMFWILLAAIYIVNKYENNKNYNHLVLESE